MGTLLWLNSRGEFLQVHESQGYGFTKHHGSFTRNIDDAFVARELPPKMEIDYVKENLLPVAAYVSRTVTLGVKPKTA